MKSLTIYQKGLLIVFIPLAVNIAWIGLYWHSLSKSSALLDGTVRNGEIIILMSRSVNLFNKTGIALFDFVKTAGNDTAKARTRKTSLEFLETLNELADKMDENSKHIVQRLISSMATIRQSLDEIADKQNLSESDIYELKIPNKLLSTMKDAHSLLKMLDVSENNFGYTLDAQKNDCGRIKSFALLGLVLNMAIAVALAIFFKLSVAKRISDVSREARSLTSDENVNQTAQAKDEFTLLEDELRGAKIKLAEADNFRRVYMTAVANRLQNSLRQCIQASSDLEKEEEKIVQEKQCDKHLKRFKASVSTCLSLVEDMLLLESMNAGNLRLQIENSDLKSIVAETIELVSNLALAKNVAVENQCESLSIPVDSARIRQVLVNLIANAIKFSSPGSPIIVKSETKDATVRIAVIDSGPGLSKQASTQLFQKFFQTAEGKAAGGTGLGLAIAKLIVEAHEGLIGVDSTPGEGAAFWIEIPRRGRASSA